MKAYSNNLRERVLTSVDAQQGTHQQVADRFRVGIQWARKILRQRRQTGSIAPKPHGGGRAPAFDPAAAVRLRQAVADNNDTTLKQLSQVADVPCSPSAVFRAPKALGITREKSPGGRPSGIAPT